MIIKNKGLKILVFGLACLLGTGFVVANAYAWNYFPGKFGQCISDSGGRGSFNSVQYACTKASNGDHGSGQIACSAWLGPAGNSTSKTIYATQDTGTIGAAIWGMCTDHVSDNANGVKNLHFTGTGSQSLSFPSGNSFSRNMNWGSPNSIPVSINIDIFKMYATKTVVGSTTRYSLPVKLWRTNAKTNTTDWDNSLIVLVIGQPGPDPEPTVAKCSDWGSVTNGLTQTLIKIKNSDLFSRSGGAVEEWNTDTIYAMPTDRIAWHACYWPGVQSEAFKEVSLVKGSYNWKGYEDLPTDKCIAADYPVEVKKLYEVPNINWDHNFELINGWHSGDRAPTGASMGKQAPGAHYTFGNIEGKEAENEMNTLTGDAGQTITETSKTSSPIKAVISAHTLDPVSIYGGTCYKYKDGNSANGNESKLDGEHTYPLCPTSGTLNEKDADGNYFDSDFQTKHPGVLKQVPAVPAVGTIPAKDAYFCWVPISGKAKSCKDCNGDKDCMENLGCNTCNGNSDCTEDCCTCNDDFQCLQCVNKYVGADSEGKRTIQVADVTKGPASKSASVTVPYNYKLDTGVEIDSDYVVYAGETVKIKDFWIDILTRYNGATYAEYSTIVPEAKYALVSYVTSDPSGLTGGEEVSGKFSDLCESINNKITDGTKKPKQCTKIIEKDGGRLNSEGALDGKWHESHLSEIGGAEQNAFDASAGDYICMVSAVWPTESASDTDTGSGGNNKSRFSTPSCVQIAKKPTFQVWGGDMYSKVNIENEFADKRNVYAGYWGGNWKLGDSFKTSGGSVTHFGSWVEEGLMLGGNNGKTDTIASGAALGERDNPEKANTGNEGKLCDKMAPLTFSNICTGGGTAESAKIASLTGSRRDLISYWVSNPGNNVSGSRNLGSLWDSAAEQESATDTEIRYLKANGSLTITGGTMSKRRLLLIDKGTADTTVTISGNIKYESPLNSLADIPKLIIYAKNINIKCNVTEIDAILIADDTVDTCSDGGDDSDSARANRLEIFGTVIANNVKLGRTYGAAAWKASGPNGQGEAAEIFNYDSSILMWSESMSSSAQTDTLQTVYQRELAPRY